jgi:hypothetical protein
VSLPHTFYAATFAGALPAPEGSTCEFSNTFTNAGQIGRTGPSQSQINQAYSDVTVTNGIQEWIVPCTSTYSITVAGASADGTRKGLGAIIKGEFYLTEGDTIKIIVGQQGTLEGEPQHNDMSSSGGGGSFVWNSNIGTPSSSNTPLIAAGGGGGGSGIVGNHTGTNASYSTSGALGTGGCPGSGGTSGGAGAPGGCDGNWWDGTGGAGWHQDSVTSGQNSGLGAPPVSVANGAVGGLGHYQSTVEGVGGFGCGAGATGDGIWGVGGGGGGYSGGGGGGNTGTDSDRGSGGGGGSYNNGQNTTTLGYQTGHGYVIIETL